MLTVIALVIFGGAYSIIYFSVSRRITTYGARRLSANKLRFKMAKESLEGINEIKVLSREPFFIQRFSQSALEFANMSAVNQLLTQLPRYFLEAVSFGGIILLTLVLLSMRGNFIAFLPLLSLYAFAAYRLLPALQEMYTAIATIRFNAPVLQVLLTDNENIAP